MRYTAVQLIIVTELKFVLKIQCVLPAFQRVSYADLTRKNAGGSVLVHVCLLNSASRLSLGSL